jgi:hypothetical protein
MKISTTRAIVVLAPLGLVGFYLAGTYKLLGIVLCLILGIVVGQLTASWVWVDEEGSDS